MKIQTFSKEQIIEALKNLDTSKINLSKIAVIRVSSSPLEDLPVPIPEENITIFNFADIEEEYWEKHRKELIEAELREEEITGIRGRFSPITKEEAEEIVEFVEKMKEKGVKLLLIHCDAGLCRSGSLAIAISEYVLNDKKQAEEFRNNPSTIENRTIIGKIKNVVNANTKESVEGRS